MPSSDTDITSLVIGCCDPSSHRARAVLDGTLAVPKCEVRHVKLGPGEMLQRSFEDPKLNVAELSLSGYVTRIDRGDCPYTLLPVYIVRMFPHAAFYARTDRGISNPADLRGKRVGTSAYQRTLNVWARGLLHDEYAVHARDVRWVIKDTPDAAAACRPDGVLVETASTAATLSELLEAGELDAMIAAHPPQCFVRGSAKVKRVIEDDDAAAADYFQRTRVFPVLHVMGVRRHLLGHRPELACDLLAAFAKAKALAQTGRESARGWREAAHTYGVGEQDRETLAAFLRYHVEQGLSGRRLAVENLFAPISMSQYERMA